jgi:hypothetical protein
MLASDNVINSLSHTGTIPYSGTSSGSTGCRSRALEAREGADPVTWTAALVPETGRVDLFSTFYDIYDNVCDD